MFGSNFMISGPIFHCFHPVKSEPLTNRICLFQLNSDQFLNVDLLLEESMHALIIGPLTPRLRESLQHYYASTRTDTLNSTNSNTSEINKLNTRDKKAFEDCMKQVKESLSPLDKLAHLLTGFKVVSNAVCICMYSTQYTGKIFFAIALSNCVGRTVTILYVFIYKLCFMIIHLCKGDKGTQKLYFVFSQTFK